MNDLQRRVAEWHTITHRGDSADKQLVKLAEEVGELCRAHIGVEEQRPNRGDVAQEAAQVIIVLASFIGRRYPDVDLFAAVEAELVRLGGRPAGTPAAFPTGDEYDVRCVIGRALSDRLAGADKTVVDRFAGVSGVIWRGLDDAGHLTRPKG